MGRSTRRPFVYRNGSSSWPNVPIALLDVIHRNLLQLIAPATLLSPAREPFAVNSPGDLAVTRPGPFCSLLWPNLPIPLLDVFPRKFVQLIARGLCYHWQLCCYSPGTFCSSSAESCLAVLTQELFAANCPGDLAITGPGFCLQMTAPATLLLLARASDSYCGCPCCLTFDNMSATTPPRFRCRCRPTVLQKLFLIRCWKTV